MFQKYACVPEHEIQNDNSVLHNTYYGSIFYALQKTYSISQFVFRNNHSISLFCASRIVSLKGGLNNHSEIVVLENNTPCYRVYILEDIVFGFVNLEFRLDSYKFDCFCCFTILVYMEDNFFNTTSYEVDMDMDEDMGDTVKNEDLSKCFYNYEGNFIV